MVVSSKFCKFLLFATAASVSFSLEPNKSLITYSAYIIGRLLINRLSEANVISQNSRDVAHYALGGLVFGKFYNAFSWVYQKEFVNSFLFDDATLENLPSGMSYLYYLSTISIVKSLCLLSLPLFCIGFLNEELDKQNVSNKFDYAKVCKNLFISSALRYFISHGIEHNLFSRGSYLIGGLVGSAAYELLDGGLIENPILKNQSQIANFSGMIVYKSFRDLCTSALSTLCASTFLLKDIYCGYDVLFSTLNKLSDLACFSYVKNLNKKDPKVNIDYIYPNK